MRPTRAVRPNGHGSADDARQDVPVDPTIARILDSVNAIEATGVTRAASFGMVASSAGVAETILAADAEAERGPERCRQMAGIAMAAARDPYMALEYLDVMGRLGIDRMAPLFNIRSVMTLDAGRMCSEDADAWVRAFDMLDIPRWLGKGIVIADRGMNLAGTSVTPYLPAGLIVPNYITLDGRIEDWVKYRDEGTRIGRDLTVGGDFFISGNAWDGILPSGMTINGILRINSGTRWNGVIPDDAVVRKIRTPDTAQAMNLGSYRKRLAMGHADRGAG
jgi:hypothetical protein